MPETNPKIKFTTMRQNPIPLPTSKMSDHSQPSLHEQGESVQSALQRLAHRQSLLSASFFLFTERRVVLSRDRDHFAGQILIAVFVKIVRIVQILQIV